MLNLFLIAVVSYLIGSLSFAYLAGCLTGKDIRKFGSGNLGATNVFRVLGVRAAVLVLAGDVLKGLAAVHIGFALGGAWASWGAVLGGVAAMAGHNWPVFLRFRGGRGVATGLGVVLYLMPGITVLAVAVFLVTIMLTRYVSAGSILAALSVLVLAWALPNPLPVRFFVLVGVPFVIFRHLPNIKRLLEGRELRIGQTRPVEGQKKD